MTRRFRGEIVQKVDGKGRVSIPAAFRRVLEQGDPDWTEGLRPELVLAYGGKSQKYIEGYTVQAMEDIENAIEAMPYGNDRSAMEMNYSTKSLQMNIDETGRIILSPLLIWAPRIGDSTMAEWDSARHFRRRRQAWDSWHCLVLITFGPSILNGMNLFFSLDLGASLNCR